MSWTYAALKRFHNSGAGCMVATASLREELAARGFTHLMPWSRGADLALFHPRPDATFDLPRPVFLSVGRVAAEKNLNAFLDLELPGSKVVVGDGPALAGLRAAYPEAHFLGSLRGEALARAYAAADVFVFPSRLDTFGVVLVEALASGLPVAAFPVTGPLDVIGDGKAGVLSEDLRAAALAALEIPREVCQAAAARYSWPAAARQFVDNVLIANQVPALAA
jgi:glycosyltransferase involved in cell wall biosynthesis